MIWTGRMSKVVSHMACMGWTFAPKSFCYMGSSYWVRRGFQKKCTKHAKWPENEFPSSDFKIRESQGSPNHGKLWKIKSLWNMRKVMENCYYKEPWKIVRKGKSQKAILTAMHMITKINTSEVLLALTSDRTSQWRLWFILRSVHPSKQNVGLDYSLRS